GVSSSGNTGYDPTTTNSGSHGNYTGSYTMTVTLASGQSTSLTMIKGTAATGTAARSALASANPGQTITLDGSGLLPSDQVVFEYVDLNSSAVGWTTVSPVSVASNGTSLQVVVPDSAVSGTVRLAREQVGLFLQVVPTVTNVDEGSSTYHGSGLTVEGSGLIEAGTTINFGNQSLADDGPSSGPDVTYDYANGSYRYDGEVNLTVPNGVPYGPITVTTFGGTSNAFPLTFTGITSTATSGTPANPNQASANPNQTIVLNGTGFNANTAIMFPAIDVNGNQYEHIVNPASVNSTGTQLTVVVPFDALTGTVSVVGDELNTAALLQIVPVVTAAYMTGVGQAQLQGFGFIEGNGSIYSFDGATVVDTSTSSGPDVYYNSANGSYVVNGLVNLAPPTSGDGALTVTTAGGTSAPFAWNAIEPNLGDLSDVASDPTSGALYVSTYNGNQIQRIDPNSGAVIGAAIPLPGGNSYGLTGLQVLPAAMTLNGVSVPAGSLLVTDGYANPDRVDAINPATGAVIATLTLHDNLDANAGVYDAATGDLYLLRGSANQVAVVDPKTGLTLSQFATPASVDYWNGGLALDPTTGALWLGSAASNVVYEVSKANGTVLSSVNLTSQGVAGIGGLSFNVAGQLLVASTDGVVFVVNLSTQAQLVLSSAWSASVAASSQAAALTSQELAPVVNSAIALWAATGISTTELSELQHVAFRITDLPGAYAGLAAPGTVYLDRDADGYGWFVDAAPVDSRAFSGMGPTGEAVASEGSPAWGHIDLLTVVAHELGHELGLSDDGGDDLMGQFLQTGVRRLPAGLPSTPSALVDTRPATTAPGESVSAQQLAAAVDHALQVGWGTDVAGSHPGMIGVTLGSGQSVVPSLGQVKVIAFGSTPSGTPNGPAWGRDRRAAHRAARGGADALAMLKRTPIAFRAKRTTALDLDEGKAGRPERS
ncbi:MAG: hypothetical protein WBX00_32635, partial [Isosphaeraceae bacterium]